MKTLLKIALCLFALVAIALTGTYFYLTNEGVQKDFVLKALQEKFGKDANFASIKIDLSSLCIKDLKLKTEKFNFNSPEILISYSSLFSLFQNELNIENAELKNASLEIANLEIDEDSQGATTATFAATTALIATLVAEPQKPKEEENAEATFLEMLVVKVENIDANLILKNESKELAQLNLKAQDLEIQSLKDIKKAHLKLDISNGILEEEISLKAQVKNLNSMRSLSALMLSKRAELLKLNAEYTPDYKDISLVSSAKISKENLPKSLVKELGDSFKLDFYAKLYSKNFFKEVEAILNTDLSTGNLKFNKAELNLLSNANLKLNAALKKDSQLLTIKTLDGEISQDKQLLAQLKLNKILSIENNQLALSEDLKDFATLYIDHIPYPVLRHYLHEYDFNTNELKAHLNLSFDPQKNEISLSTKEEVYIQGLEILKNEAIVVSDLFFATNFITSIDLNQNILLSTDFRFKESKSSELKANITAEKVGDKTTARIFASGDAITLLHTVQAHIDNVEAIRNSQLDLNLHIVHQGENLEIDEIIAKLYDKDYELFKVLLSDKLRFKNYELQNDTLKAKILAQALPFAPFKAYVKDIDATSISCDIDIEKKDDLILANGTASLENLSFIQDGKAIIKEFNPSIEFSTKCVGDDVDAQIKRFAIAHKDTEILRGNADIKANLASENYITKATSKANIYLPALMQIDMLKEYNNIQSAHAEVAVDFDGKLLKSKTKISNLKLKSEAGYISSMTIDATKDLLEAEKDIDLNLKIASPNGQSDISSKITIKGDKIASILNSKKLILDDILFLSKIATKTQDTQAKEESAKQEVYKKPAKSDKPLSIQERKAQALAAAQKQVEKENREYQELQGSQESPATPAKSPTKVSAKKAKIIPQEKSIWDIGYNLSLTTSLNELILKEEKILTKLNTVINLDKNSIKSKNITFNALNASEGKASFSIDFEKPKKEQYALSELKIAITNIDTKKLTLNKNKKTSLMEGIVNFDLDLNSRAQSPELLAEKIKGKATLKNKGKGVIRLVNANSKIGAATQLASSLMGLADAFLGDSVKEIAPINTIIDTFKKFKYSELSAVLVRGDSLDIEVEEMTIRNDGYLSILGDGKITYDANKAIADQALNISATVYVEDDDLAGLFNKLNLIEAESDIKNFHKGPSFKASGSLNNMQNNLMEILGNTATDGASNLLNSLFE